MEKGTPPSFLISRLPCSKEEGSESPSQVTQLQGPESISLVWEAVISYTLHEEEGFLGLQYQPAQVGVAMCLPVAALVCV